MNTRPLYIQNGRLVDPRQGLDTVTDLIIKDQKVTAIGTGLTVPADSELIDATGLIVAPGFIDLHVHLREPGQSHKETIETGTLAAARGGFTSVCCMANTDPVNDSPIVTEWILKRAAEKAIVNVFPIASLTHNLEGKEISPIGALKQAGCVALSDDGKTVANAALFRNALNYAKGFDLPVVSHCLCPDLMGQGLMHEGAVSTEIGLRGIPREAEDLIVFRDLLLAHATGARVHIAHLSTEGAVELVRSAKAKGWKISAEVTPHHFSLTDEACRNYDPNTKMAPPLRTLEDVKAIKKGLADGTIDIIATDHAPHASFEKELEFDQAPFGIIGLETALPLSLRLVREGTISLSRLIALLSTRPAELFGLNRGDLSNGAIADLVLFDPEKRWIYKAASGASKSQNSPFDGWEFKGKVCYTIVAGKVVFKD